MGSVLIRVVKDFIQGGTTITKGKLRGIWKHTTSGAS